MREPTPLFIHEEYGEDIPLTLRVTRISYNINTKSQLKVTRTEEMIKKLLLLKQNSPGSIVGNV